MAKGIKKTEAFEGGDSFFDGVIRGAHDLIKLFDLMEQNIRVNLEASREFLNAWKAEGAKSIHDVTKAVNESNEAIKTSNEIAIQKQQLLKVTAEAEKAELALKKQVLAQEKALQKEKEKTESLYKRESARLREMKNAYKDLVLAGKENDTVTKQLKKDLDALDVSLKKVDKSTGDHYREVGNYSKALQGVGGKLKALAGIALAGFSVAGIVNFTGHLFEMQDQLEAVDRKARAVFGEAFPALQQEAENTANAMGITNGEYIKTITNLTQMQQNLGFTTEEASRQAKQILQTANTLSLFDSNGRSAAEVAEELGNALTGQVKSLKQYGIVVDKNLDIEEAQAQGLESSKTAASQKAKALQILGQVTQQTTKLNVGAIKEMTDAEMAERQEEVRLRQAEEDLAIASEDLKAVWVTVKATLGELILTLFTGNEAMRNLEKSTGPIREAYTQLQQTWEKNRLKAGEFLQNIEKLNVINDKGRIFTGEFRKEYDKLADTFIKGNIALDDAAVKYEDLKKRQLALNAEEEKKNADQLAKDTAAANALALKTESDQQRQAREAAQQKERDAKMKAIEKEKTLREIKIEEEVQGEFEVNAAKLISDEEYLKAKRKIELEYNEEIAQTDLAITKNANDLTELLNKQSFDKSKKYRQDAEDKDKKNKEDKQKEIDDFYESQERTRQETADKEEQDREDKLKAEEELFESRKELAEEFLSAIESNLSKENDLAQKKIEDEIDMRQKAIDRQLELGQRGSSEQLAFEKAELAKAQLAREEQNRKELRQAKALAVAKAYIANLERGDDSGTALANAFRDSVLLEVVSGFFAEGTENLKGPGTETSDSIIAALSKGESVVTAKATKRRPGLATAWNEGREEEFIMQNIIPKMMLYPTVGTSGDTLTAAAMLQQLTLLNEKVQSLEKTTRNKKENYFELTNLNEVIVTEVKEGLKQTIKKRNPRARG